MQRLQDHAKNLGKELERRECQLEATSEALSEARERALESEQEAERRVEEMYLVLHDVAQLNSERERLHTILEEVLLLLTLSQTSIASLEVSAVELAREHIESKPVSQRSAMPCVSSLRGIIEVFLSHALSELLERNPVTTDSMIPPRRTQHAT